MQGRPSLLVTSICALLASSACGGRGGGGGQTAPASASPGASIPPFVPVSTALGADQLLILSNGTSDAITLVNVTRRGTVSAPDLNRPGQRHGVMDASADGRILLCSSGQTPISLRPRASLETFVYDLAAQARVPTPGLVGVPVAMSPDGGFLVSLEGPSGSKLPPYRFAGVYDRARCAMLPLAGIDEPDETWGGERTVSADANRILYVWKDALGDQRIRVYDRRSQSIVFDENTGSGPFSAPFLTADGRHVWYQSRLQMTVRSIDLDSGATATASVLPTPAGQLFLAGIDPDASFLAFVGGPGRSSYDAVNVFDASPGVLDFVTLPAIGSTVEPLDLTLGRGGRYLVGRWRDSATAERRTRLYDRTAGAIVTLPDDIARDAGEPMLRP